MITPGTTSLGTLVVYLAANASQYERALKVVEASTAASMEQVVKSVKYATVGVIGTLGLIGAAGVREFGKLDEAMVHSIAILGHVSDDTRKRMEDMARSIAKGSTNSADKVASAYQGLASAGLDAQQSMSALATVEKFAVAGQLQMNQSVLMLTDSVGALGLASSDAAQYQKNITRVADVLAQGANISQASVEELAVALQGKVAGGLRLVNKSVEEGVAVLGAFAKAGIKGQDASEKFSQVLRDLQVSALEQPATWRQMGLSVYDAAGNMRGFADIVQDLEKALGPLSSEEKRQALTMLGFQDRSVSAMQALLGFSGLIRDYESDLKKAGGTTQDMAATQLTSLNAQFTILLNNLKDALITIGDALLPVLQTFGAYIGDANKQTAGFADTVRTTGDLIKTGLLVVVGVIADVVAGYQLIVKGGQMAIVAATTIIMNLMAAAVEGIQALVSKAVDGINFVRREFAVLRGDFANYKPIEFKGFDLAKEWRAQAEGTDEVLSALAEEFGKLVDKGRPSVKIMEDFGKAQEKNMGYSSGAAKSVGAFNTVLPKLNTNLSGTATAANAASFSLIKFDNATRDPLFSAMVDGLKEVENAMVKGAISAKQYEAAVRDVVSKQNQFVFPVKGMMNQTGDQNVDQFVDLNNEEKLLVDSYNRKLKAVKDYYTSLGALTKDQEEAKNALLTQMDENYLAQQTVFQQKRGELILASAQNIGDSLTSIAKDLAGEQSGIYKAMFAVSKAFAIADSLVKIQQGVANAAALPWPVNLGAMASVAAATASIVSNIMAIGMSFEGGGSTGSGPRSGGLDGKGGFMAMLHPKERVIDLHKGQDGTYAAAGGVTVNVHNYAGAEVTTQPSNDGRSLDVIIRKTEERIASNVRARKGPLTGALEEAGMQRRGR